MMIGILVYWYIGILVYWYLIHNINNIIFDIIYNIDIISFMILLRLLNKIYYHDCRSKTVMITLKQPYNNKPLFPTLVPNTCITAEK